MFKVGVSALESTIVPSSVLRIVQVLHDVSNKVIQSIMNLYYLIPSA